MTTAPETATPVTNSAIVTTLQKDWSWLVSHLILLVFVGALVTGAVYGVEGLMAKHDAATATKYTAILAQQTAQTQSLIQQYQADRAATAVRDAQYMQTIAQLSKSIQMRDTNAKQQQQVDATLDAAGAASRLATQTGAATGEVTVSGNNVVLDLPITRRVVTGLDQLIVAQADLKDTQGQLTAQTGLTADANTKLADADKVIDSQTKQLADETKACNAQVKALKAHYHKKLIKVGVISYVAGFVSGVVATLAK